ncbi:MAG: hypothetical protein ACRDZX_17230 [Acidimicrobiales bacterium]
MPGPDWSQIWEMLVARDIRAFVAGDWDQVAGDFLADAFVAGLDGGGHDRHPCPPLQLQIALPRLGATRSTSLADG